jgi:integrase
VRHKDPDGSPARLSESTVRLACRRRAAQAGLSAFSPHDLRRTSISDLLDLTGDLALVSELAGHANPATTKRYDRRPAENRRRAARSLHVPYKRRMNPVDADKQTARGVDDSGGLPPIARLLSSEPRRS